MSWITNNYSSKGNIFHNHMCEAVYLNFASVVKLADAIVSPNFTIGDLFADESEYLSHLIWLPFKPKVSRDGTLGIGNHTFSDIPASFIDASGSLYDLGEKYITRYFNNFADYNGYTRINIYLPFYGFVEINPNDVIGKYIQFRLSMNYQTGQGTYIIGVTEESVINANKPYYTDGQDDYTRIIATYVVQMGQAIPIGKTNAANITRNLTMGLVKSAATLGSFALGSSMGAFVSSSTNKGSVKTIVNTRKTNPKTGRLKTVKSTSYETAKNLSYTTDRTGYHTYLAATDIFDNSIQTLNACHFGISMDKPSDAIGLIDCDTSIRIIIYRPKLKDADSSYGKLYGFPLGEVKKISDCSGYTEISATHIEGVGFESITEAERNMLIEALGEGVIV